MKQKSKLTIIILSVFLAAVGAIWGCKEKEKETGEKVVNKEAVKEQLLAQNIAPDFVVTDLNGKKISSSQFKGKVVLLHFWATWCYYCRQEITPLNELYRNYGKQGLVILAVSLDSEGVAAVRKLQSNVKMDYQVALGNDQITADYGNIRGLPTSFIIDSNWKIVRKHMGYVPKEVIEKDIKELLSKQG